MTEREGTVEDFKALAVQLRGSQPLAEELQAEESNVELVQRLHGETVTGLDPIVVSEPDPRRFLPAPRSTMGGDACATPTARRP